MDKRREIHPDVAHGLQGPHDKVATFTPLRLRLPDGAPLEVKRSRAVLGRHSEADVRLAFADVSRRHCLVAFEMGQWRVYDLDSLNGVYVNDERIVEAALYAGDVLRLGDVPLTV